MFYSENFHIIGDMLNGVSTEYTDPLQFNYLIIKRLIIVIYLFIQYLPTHSTYRI